MISPPVAPTISAAISSCTEKMSSRSRSYFLVQICEPGTASVNVAVTRIRCPACRRVPVRMYRVFRVLATALRSTLSA
jgi:hypothetical protein